MQMPAMPTVEAGQNTESATTSGLESAVESAILAGNAPALVQVGTQKTQAATTRIQAIASIDPNQADAPEIGVLSAIATQAQGLANDAHREYVDQINRILQAQPQPQPQTSMAAQPEIVKAEMASLVIPPQMPGFEPVVVATPAVPSPVEKPAPSFSLLPIAAQVYLEEREESNKQLNEGQMNYEGHSLTSAVPYYEAVLAQDPTDKQWIHFVEALKLEKQFFETKLNRSELALQVNQLQNSIEDNRKHNILPTNEQLEQLQLLQKQFEQANLSVSTIEKAKRDAEAAYNAAT